MPSVTVGSVCPSWAITYRYREAKVAEARSTQAAERVQGADADRRQPRADPRRRRDDGDAVTDDFEAFCEEWAEMLAEIAAALIA